MIKILKIAICLVVALVAVGCEVAFDGDVVYPGPAPAKPTVPLTKRPIVPSTKLPRPRVVEDLEVDVYVVDEECQVIAEEGL